MKKKITMLNEMRLFLWDTYQEWRKDHPELLAAGLGYFMLFSLPPLVILGSAFLGVLSNHMDTAVLLTKLAMLIGSDATVAVAGFLNVAAGAGKAQATVFSVIVLWLAGSSVFTHVQSALNIIWKASRAKRSFWREFIVTGFQRVAVVVGVTLFLALVFLTDTALAFFSRKFPGFEVIHLWQFLSWVASWALLTMLVAGVYRLVPNAKIEWKDVWPGAAITAILFSIGKMVITLYVGLFSLDSAYGAASSAIVIMIWIYFSAQIFFFGAKLTWLYSRRYGSQAK